MAKNYNPRSGSSASRKPNAPGKAKRSSGAQRGNRTDSETSFGRNRVTYIQSAKTDLAAKTPESDPRTRYARYRSDKSIRVLGDPEESKLSEKHRIYPQFEDETPGTGQRRSAGSADIAGVSVREHRERQRALQRRRGKAPGRILIVLISLLALVAIGFAVYSSPAFSVREVKVEGAHRLTSERLTELAAVPASSTLLRLDAKGIESRIASDPWIQSVEVRRSFPSTVVLIVTERQIGAVVEQADAGPAGSTVAWLLSTDGIWLGSYNKPAALPENANNGATDGGSEADAAGAGEADGETPDAGAATDGDAQRQDSGVGASLLEGVLVGSSEVDGMIHIKDVSRNRPPLLGQGVADEGVANALALINGFSPEMLVLVESISAPDRINTTLTLTNHVGVAFGAAEDIAAKEQVILRLLAEHEGLITYINVRVADRATYRTAG